MTDPVRRIGGDVDLDLDPDDIVAPLTDGERINPFEQLKATLQEDADVDEVTLECNARPGVSVRYSLKIDGEQLNGWRKRAQDKSQPDGVDALKFACTVVANTASCLVMNGKDVVVPDTGLPVNFKGRALLEMVGAGRALDAVKKVFGNDGHIYAHCNEVLRRAGYDPEDVREADPTAI